MRGTMMKQQLVISDLIKHAAIYHGDTEIISRETDGTLSRSTWKQAENEARRLLAALLALGHKKGDRIATIAWNNQRHLAIWFAISGGGMVCHTINPRLFPEQVIFIGNDASDRALFFDKTFLPLIKATRDHLKTVKHLIYMGGHDVEVAAELPGVLFYDDLVKEEPAEWPTLDENTPSSLCYTSGTTGNPKGVLYYHRSTVIHTFAISLPDSLNLSSREIILPVVPMFHANAWGIPYAAAMCGATLVLPGPKLDGESLLSLIDSERVTLALGVPTIWQMLLAAAAKTGSKMPSLTRNVIGGSAAPPSMIAAFRNDHDCETIHAWGMTETSPLGTANQVKAKHAGLDAEALELLRRGQGRPPFGMELRVVDQHGKVLPPDGQSQGALQCRGHWVVDTYFGMAKSSLTPDGWFDTGDVATLDADGYMVIRDRTKDVIKSGGEWISSVELENIAMSHPGIAMAAAIGAKHEKWDERPIIIAVKAEGQDPTEADLIAHFEGKIAKWQIPDMVVFIKTMPLTGTGKMLKNKLREDFENILTQRNK